MQSNRVVHIMYIKYKEIILKKIQNKEKHT